MKLSDITGTIHSASIKIGEGELNFTFSEYSPKTIKDVNKKVIEATKTKKDTTYYIELLLATLKSWDVTDADGKPLEISREILMEFGNSQFSKIVNAMNEACSPSLGKKSDAEEEE